MDLDKYGNEHIEYLEADPVPEVCKNCDDDCYYCDYGGLRWRLTERALLVLKRKSKARAVKKLLQEIERIDAEIEGLCDDRN